MVGDDTGGENDETEISDETEASNEAATEISDETEASNEDAMEPAMPPARVDHVGIAVGSVDDAEGVLLALGCERVHREVVDGEGFEWATYVLGEASRLELIAPVEEESFLADYLSENGPGLHHVTLEVADADAAVAAAEAAGLRVVGHAERDGWTEAFVSPSNPTGALFQFMEYGDDYGERGPDAALYVGGERLE